MRFFLLMTVLLIFSACTRTEILKSSDAQEVAVECLPIYGNWCGEGYPAYLQTGYRPPAVDVWDEACKAHDLCYDGEGGFSKDICDRAFAAEIELLYKQGHPVPRAMNAAYAFFNQSIVYHNNLVLMEDVEKAQNYSCRGGDGQAALFCNVGMGRDDCELDLGYYAENGECYCDYSPDIWSEAERKWGTEVYSASY